MTDRQQKILNKIIELYVVEKHPIGSILIAKELNLGSSTIRNEMLTLDKEGFLINKGSLGRIPTDKGLRYYFEKCSDYTVSFNINKVKTKLIPLSCSKIDTISFMKTNNSKIAILTILFENHEILNKLINLSEHDTAMDIVKINEILKKTFQLKNIITVNKTISFTRYEKQSYYNLLKEIMNYIESIPQYKLDIDNLAEVYKNNFESIFDIINSNIILEKLSILPDNLFIGEEHEIDLLVDYIIYKNNNIIYFINKFTDLSILKYNLKEGLLSEN